MSPHSTSYINCTSSLQGTLTGGDGVKVWDAHRQMECTKWIELSLMTNDTRGACHPVHGFEPGALLGACGLDWLRGISVANRTVYPGAVCALDRQDPLRLAYAAEFKEFEHCKLLATAREWVPMTHKDAIEAGEQVERQEVKEKESPYKGRTLIVCGQHILYGALMQYVP